MARGKKRVAGSKAGQPAVRRGGGAQLRRRTFWSERKKQRFLEKLAESCNVSMAAEHAGVYPSRAYELRSRDAAFRAGWALALKSGYAKLELMLMERAFNGDATRVLLKERSDGSSETVKEYGTQLAMMLLKLHRGAALEDDPAAGDETRLDEEAEQARAEILRKLARLRARQDDMSGSGEADG